MWLKKFFDWLGKRIRYWFFTKPVSEPTPLTAKEVINHWTVIDYNGQKVQIHKNEMAIWNGLSRKDKRAMAKRFETMEKKGKIKFVEINGIMTMVYNRDYEARAEKAKQINYDE